VQEGVYESDMMHQIPAARVVGHHALPSGDDLGGQLDACGQHSPNLSSSIGSSQTLAFYWFHFKQGKQLAPFSWHARHACTIWCRDSSHHMSVTRTWMNDSTILPRLVQLPAAIHLNWLI
jgi:hypothetical protein